MIIDPTGIYTAIVQHNRWKVRLKSAVDSGRRWENYDPSPDRCEFGAWLNNNREQLSGNTHYENIYIFHRLFHREAENIVTLAVAGDKEKAAQALEYGGKFEQISQKLVKAMLAWHDYLSGKA